jgi:hypothetical protein
MWFSEALILTSWTGTVFGLTSRCDSTQRIFGLPSIHGQRIFQGQEFHLLLGTSSIFYARFNVSRRSQGWSASKFCGMYKHSIADPSGRAVAGVAGSNPTRGMDICLFCLYVMMPCVGRGLCDGLITRPEESYRVSNCMWSRNPEKGGQRSILDCKRLWWMNEWMSITITGEGSRV